MVVVSVENKGAYRCLTAWRAGHSKIMCNFHLQQPHYHNVCRPYRLWQHADPKQNARQQLAAEEREITML